MSRDVTFYEDQFPLAEQSDQHAVTKPFPSLPNIPFMGCEEVSFHLPPEEPPPVMLDHNEPSNDDINGHKPLSRSAIETGCSIDDASVEATQQSTRSIQLRRSSRQRQAPSRLLDYYCDAAFQHKTSPHICHL